MHYIKAIVVSICMFFFWGTERVQASHVAGCDLTYICIGTDSFMLTANCFSDCCGIPFGATTATVDFASDCGDMATVDLDLIAPPGQTVPGGQEISQLCPSAVGNSCCNSTSTNAHPGMNKFTFQGLIVLNPRCDKWVASFEAPDCCPNPNVNVPNRFDLYVETTMYTSTDSCNCSPEFEPVFDQPYSCVGQEVCYDYGVVEKDGDSLVYSFDTAWVNNTTPGNYDTANGFSAFNPILGITIDSTSGKVNFISGIAGHYVVVVKVCEYERGTGLILGCVRRDMQFVVENCNNKSPSLCYADTIDANSYSGSGAIINSNTVEVCYGQSFTFDVIVSDSNFTDTLKAFSNIDSVLPGATFISNGWNPVTCTFGWTATIGANPFSTFSLEVRDNQCPIPASNSSTFNVKVVPSTWAGEDVQICRGIETKKITAIGGKDFKWSVISGDPITPANFSCDSCASVTVSPRVTTTYAVVSDLSASCKNKDTITVVVSNLYSLTSHNDTTICFNDSTIKIFTKGSLNRNYKYKWSPSKYLDNDTLRTPNISPIVDRNYYVTVTSDSGCVRKDTVKLGVTPPFPSSITAQNRNALSCTGGSSKLGVKLGYNVTKCGPSNLKVCPGAIVDGIVGTGTLTNGSTEHPTPYGGQFYSTRSQYLIRASDLTASGVGKGVLTSLSFDVTNLNFTTDFFNYTIKIGCTSSSSISTWVVGLTQVFSPKAITLTGGINVHNFDQYYDWNGTSNLVVEICFQNLTPSNNVSVNSSKTNYASLLYYAPNTPGSACNSPNISAPPDSVRPNMIFGICPGADTNAYTYNWWPTTGLSDSSAFQPIASVTKSTTYYIEVADTFGKCFDTTEVRLDVANVNAGRDTAICFGDSIQLNAVVTSSCQNPGKIYWTPATGLSNDSIVNPIVNITSPQTYYINYTDPCGCVLVDTLFVDIRKITLPAPVITHPSCGELNGSISLSPSGGYKPYYFSKDWGNTFAINDSLMDGLDVALYGLLVVDSIGCMSDTIEETLKNLSSPVINNTVLTDPSCFEFNDGSININATGGLLPYKYSLDSGKTYSTSNPSNSLTKGAYTLIVMADDSCKSESITVFLQDPPKFEYTFNVVHDRCYNLGDASASAIVTGGTAPYTYDWGVFSKDSLGAVGLYAGIDSLEITDGKGCKLDTVFEITQPKEIVYDFLNITDITCNGYDNGIVAFGLAGGNPPFRYSVDSGMVFILDPFFTNLGPQLYNIYAEDANGCIFTSTVTFNDPPAVLVEGSFDTTYICENSTVELSAIAQGGNGAPYSYNWSPNLGNSQTVTDQPNGSKTYAVYAEDNIGCVSQADILQVFQYDPLEIHTSNDTFMCKGTNLELYAEVTGGEGTGYKFEWTPFFGLTNPLSSNPSASPLVSQTYVIKVWDDCGSTVKKEEVFVAVNEIPEIEVELQNEIGCEPLSVVVNNTSSLAYDCYLTTGSGVFTNCGISTPVFYKQGEYDLTLTVTSEEGCANTKVFTDTIIVYPKPKANFVMDPKIASIENTEIEFSDISSGNIIAWNWNFAGLDFSEAQNTTYEFPDQDTGKYNVSLEVITDKGCKDDTVLTAIIGAEYLLFVPNAFTPSGSSASSEGVNDIFFPVLSGAEGTSYHFMVFDRWGKLVYETYDLDDGWNGKEGNIGNDLPTGVYVWKVVVGDYTNENLNHEEVGEILLVR